MKEEAARKLMYCPACKEEKALGLIVCWHCFKHRRDITPLKYYNGSLEDWLLEEVLTGSTSQQPTFVTPLGRIAIIIFGIILLYYATRIYLTGSAVVIVDENSISYKLKDEILKLEWSDVVNVTSSPFCGGISFGAGELLTLETSKNTKLSVNSYIKGYENLKQEIYAKTKKQS